MKRLELYLKNRVEVIHLLLEKPRRSYNKETFHKLRVEIKKLNALFDLINYCSDDFKRNKTFKSFKQIFQQAGKVRELQIEEAMLKKYFTKNLLSEYKNRLKDLRLKERDSFFSIINKKFSEKLKRKYRIIKPFLKQVTKKKVNKYMDKQEMKINKLLIQNNLPIPQAHELRKRLKTFNYNQKVLNFWNQDKQPKNKKVLPELLGKWNDCQVTITDLEKALVIGNINSDELCQLIKIKEKIVSESSNLFYLINSTIAKSKGSIE